MEHSLGLRSCGIPPRKILHDKEGGRKEKVRTRTGNGDVHIKPGWTFPKCPSIENHLSTIHQSKMQYERVACRRSWAAARFRRWSLLMLSYITGNSWFDENDARLRDVLFISSIASDIVRCGRVAMGLDETKRNSNSSFFSRSLTEVEVWNWYLEIHRN